MSSLVAESVDPVESVANEELQAELPPATNVPKEFVKVDMGKRGSRTLFKKYDSILDTLSPEDRLKKIKEFQDKIKTPFSYYDIDNNNEFMDFLRRHGYIVYASSTSDNADNVTPPDNSSYTKKLGIVKRRGKTNDEGWYLLFIYPSPDLNIRNNAGTISHYVHLEKREVLKIKQERSQTRIVPNDPTSYAPIMFSLKNLGKTQKVMRENGEVTEIQMYEKEREPGKFLSTKVSAPAQGTEVPAQGTEAKQGGRRMRTKRRHRGTRRRNKFTKTRRH